MRISFGIKPPIDTRHGYPKTPDLDKLVRGVLDALTGVCYVDDSQVTTIECEKVWRPFSTIEIWHNAKQTTSAQTSIWTKNAQGLGTDT